MQNLNIKHVQPTNFLSNQRLKQEKAQVHRVN